MWQDPETWVGPLTRVSAVSRLGTWGVWRCCLFFSHLLTLASAAGCGGGCAAPSCADQLAAAAQTRQS